MGVGMGVAGGALALGGGLLNYFGQRQGAKAMQEEADRQVAEQGEYGVRRQQQLAEALGKYNPQAATNGATADLVRRGGAINPTLAAGGEALGLSPSSIAHVGQAIMPMQRVAAQRVGQAGADTRHRALFDAAGRDMAATDESARAAASLYPMRTNAAGSKGAMLRTGGELMQGAGMATMTAAMNQAPEAPAEATDAELANAYGDTPGPEDVQRSMEGDPEYQAAMAERSAAAPAANPSSPWLPRYATMDAPNMPWSQAASGSLLPLRRSGGAPNPYTQGMSRGPVIRMTPGF